jgi:hypothetical protein
VLGFFISLKNESEVLIAGVCIEVPAESNAKVASAVVPPSYFVSQPADPSFGSQQRISWCLALSSVAIIVIAPLISSS